MLGKLIKHEFKQSARSVMLIYASAAAVILFVFFGMLTKITWIGIVGSIVLYIVALVGIVMTLVSVIKNFYDTLYTITVLNGKIDHFLSCNLLFLCIKKWVLTFYI